MLIELRPIDSVRPYENNPRKNDDAVEAVAASLREFGFRQPLVVDVDGVLIVGDTRLKAAKKLGFTEVPVHVATDLTPDQIKAYRIADNQTNELSDWDYDLLVIELGSLKDADYDLDLLGFGADGLAKIMNGDLAEGLTDPDAVPALPDAATTQPGDIWILGNHRLMCGDSSKPEDLDRLLDGQSIHLVASDPPYNVCVEPRSNNAIAAGGSGKNQSLDLALSPGKNKATNKQLRAKDRPLANDFVSEEKFDQLLLDWFKMVHLTEKPVELATRAMQYSSRPGENVLDLFGGSGSTLIGAEQTGRRAFLMELDPLYCDVIVQRFEQFTGKKAERLVPEVVA